MMKAHFGNTATGRQRTTFTLTEDEFECMRDDNGGACLACGEEAFGIEPDARGYQCESCEANTVFGIEELLLMGRVEITGDDFDLLDID